MFSFILYIRFSRVVFLWDFRRNFSRNLSKDSSRNDSRGFSRDSPEHFFKNCNSSRFFSYGFGNYFRDSFKCSHLPNSIYFFRNYGWIFFRGSFTSFSIYTDIQTIVYKFLYKNLKISSWKFLQGILQNFLRIFPQGLLRIHSSLSSGILPVVFQEFLQILSQQHYPAETTSEYIRWYFFERFFKKFFYKSCRKFSSFFFRNLFINSLRNCSRISSEFQMFS